MIIEQLEKFLVRPDPVGVDPVVPQILVHEQGKHRQTTLGSLVKNWPRIRTALNVFTGRSAREFLRSASGLLLVVGAAHLGSLALIDDDRPVDRTRIIPANQQQAITPSDQQQTIVPLDQQQVTISSRSGHDAPPEDSLPSTPPDVAIESLKSSPAVSPRENAIVPANDAGYVVQVSAERSDAKAQASFKTLQSRYPRI